MSDKSDALRGKQGLASMDPEKRRAICSKGGAAVKAEDRSFSRNRELARAAGRKGGKAISDEKRGFARDPAFARECARKGGIAKRDNDARRQKFGRAPEPRQ